MRYEAQKSAICARARYSDNSWLSKIHLCQHIAENVLGFPATARADWLSNLHNAFWAWSD